MREFTLSLTDSLIDSLTRSHSFASAPFPKASDARQMASASPPREEHMSAPSPLQAQPDPTCCTYVPTNAKMAASSSGQMYEDKSFSSAAFTFGLSLAKLRGSGSDPHLFSLILSCRHCSHFTKDHGLS